MSVTLIIPVKSFFAFNICHFGLHLILSPVLNGYDIRAIKGVYKIMLKKNSVKQNYVIHAQTKISLSVEKNAGTVGSNNYGLFILYGLWVPQKWWKDRMIKEDSC
jgi:hypothetical protein